MPSRIHDHRFDNWSGCTIELPEATAFFMQSFNKGADIESEAPHAAVLPCLSSRPHSLLLEVKSGFSSLEKTRS
jgi:hypothetical protein